jgi:ABC-type polysaccharide/polyol phosphate export permease
MLEINPMHWLIQSWRDIVIFETWPDPSLLLRFGVVSVLFFWLGGRFFRRNQDLFPDLL